MASIRGPLKSISQAALIYLIFVGVGRGREPSAAQLRTLADVDEITVGDLPSISANKDLYLRTISSKIQEATDYSNPVVRSFAANLAGRYPGDFSPAQATAMFEHIRSNWTYINDPAKLESFQRASQTILSNLVGDCDDYAILMAAMILAIGGRARLNIGFGPRGGHAWSEMWIGSNKSQADTAVRQIIKVWRLDLRHAFDTAWRWIKGRNYTLNYRKDRNGQFWLNLDYSSEHPGGPYFESTTRYVILPDSGDYYDASG